MGELSDFKVGQTVELQDGQTATVQFKGNTHFAAGAWIGVVLDDATGKNDGSVQGQRYFECPPGHGMFLRPTVLTILEQPTPKANGRSHSKYTAEGIKSMQSLVSAKGLRESTADPAGARRQSINAGSPTPRVKGSGTGRSLGSPIKSPTKHLDSTTSSGNTTPPTTSSSVQHSTAIGARTTRPSMGPPSAPASNVRSSRQSITRPMNGSARPTSVTSASSRASSNRLSLRPGPKSRLSSISGESHASVGSGCDPPAQSLELEADSPPVADAREEVPFHGNIPARSQDLVSSQSNILGQQNSSRSRNSISSSQKPPIATNLPSREVEDLKTKLRVMEKKRMEDRERLKVLERVQGERDKFEGIIQKLQSKYQPQQQEAADLRTQLKGKDAEIEDLERQQAENDSVLEVATLDREMAEETAESLRNELDALRQNHEELRLEVEVLREENQELSQEMNPEERTSQGWLQMERSNERLREALMRLRDATQEHEADLTRQIGELEGDVRGLRNAREEQLRFELALVESEATVAELRQQLEVALGAEEMIEELTEKNLGLSEQIENLRATVEELESLKELNDELEINHTENAKQMQEEIDYKDILLAEHATKASTQVQTIQDLEYTITRFRNLVTSMQTDLEDMRTSQQLTETEANDLNSRSRVMMDLNLRLQASASKAQVKAIDLELGRLEAQESVEHLSIVQLFLPDSFKVERNSIRAYLRLRRIKSKADILLDYVKGKANIPPGPSQENDVYTRCEVMDKLTFIAHTCTRFERSIQSCDLGSFSRLESALFDLEPVERAFNNWIEAAKKDELKEQPCATELSRTIALVTHLAEVHINDSLERYADDIHARALTMQGQLESTLIALARTKVVMELRLKSPDTVKDGEDPDLQAFSRKSDSLIAQTRNAKAIIGKTIRQLDDLQSRSLTLDQAALPDIQRSQASTSDLSDSTRSFGQSITALLEESSSEPLDARDLSSAATAFDHNLSSLSNKILTATTSLQAFCNLTANLSHTVEMTDIWHPPPWQLLAEKLAMETTTLATHENEVARLNDEARERSTALAMRDKSLEELHVKLETLEKRASESGGRRERARELEKIVEAAKEREVELILTVNRLRSERNDLREQRDSTVSRPEGAPGSSAAVDQPGGLRETTSEASLVRISSLEAEIQTLQAAIRHLRAAAYTHTISSAWDFLGRPLVPQPSAREQRIRLKQSEAKSVVSELLRLVTDAANGVVRLKERKKGERLEWRPARETCSWQIGRAKEEWEEWREWRDDFSGHRRIGGKGKDGHRGGEASVV
ncbi:MAG: hypothetical protein Q9185_006363 [Variospora sp. 1 TL-2023]